MIGKAFDRAFRPMTRFLQSGPMKRLGIRNTMRLAKKYNGLLYGKYHRYREKLHNQDFQTLVQENGSLGGPVNQMNDGWVLDTSGDLPYLEELLKEGEEVIQERGGKEPTADRYRSFFRNIIGVEDLDRWPSFLNFITSSEVLQTMCHYLEFIPCLSRNLPPGVRCVESWKEYDAESHLPLKDSQLFHIDPYATPMMYVIVLLRDCTPEQGPFSFLSESISQETSRKLGYWNRGKPYRLNDDEVYSSVDPNELHELLYPKGTVLFIDSSRCLHFGSRDAAVPRYQIMYGLVSPTRADFSDSIVMEPPFTLRDSDSELRRLILDKYYLGKR